MRGVGRKNRNRSTCSENEESENQWIIMDKMANKVACHDEKIRGSQ